MQEEILIVEDDTMVAEGLVDILGDSYRVSSADTGKKVIECIRNQSVNLVILDINLDGENGYEICKNIRKISDVPVLFLTAYSSEIDLIRGFRAGGDDYLTKPFRMQELLVRVQALIRRYNTSTADKLQSGNLVYHMNLHQISSDSETMNLTPVELKIASLLMQRYPQAVSRRQLLYDVWDQEEMFVEENTLNVNISRLREKLGTFEGMPYIVTVRGVGYRWNVPVRR